MTVERRPQAYKLGGEIDATIIDSDGYATVLFYYHGLSDGDVVYIKSEVESYNGYKFVEVMDPVTFRIRDTENGENIAFYKEVDIVFFENELTHGWVAVHQPIVYQISNDKYPVNDAYLTATIVNVTDNNGYLRIVCSGAIDSDLVDLDYVKINDVVYQVKDAETDSIATLEFVYDSTLAAAIMGESVTLHYNNYHVVVNVYGGLNSSHPYANLKPYTLLATLKFIPDADNLVMFDIADILRAQVGGDNKLLLDTLPLNLEAFTQFYISYGEAYDVSDGSEIVTYEEPHTFDTFEGYAIDAVMPFKSRAINTLSDYVACESIGGNFLTIFARPVYIPELFFDLSFIKNVEGNYQVDINGNSFYFEDKGIGVYRHPLLPEMIYAEDEICVSVLIPGYTSPAVPADPQSLVALSAFTNNNVGNPDWTTGATPSVTLPSPPQSADRLIGSLSGVSAGVNYTFNYSVTITGTNPINVQIGFHLFQAVPAGLGYDSDGLIVYSTGTYTGQVTLKSPTFVPVYFGFTLTNTEGASITGTVNSVSIVAAAGSPSEDIPALQVANEICIDVIDNLCLNIIQPSGETASGSGGDCPPGILSEGQGYILLE